MRIPLTFSPRQRGLRTFLGELESAVMEQAWEQEQVTVKEVHGKLSKKRELAYTTVMTVMGRLAEKGLLRKQKGAGAANVYSPACTRDEFLKQATSNVLRGLMTQLATPTMSQFVDMISAEDEETLDELARLIEEKRKERS